MSLGMGPTAGGALLPDIDTTTSGIGRWIKPLSGMLERKLGHRTLTHTLLGFAGLALVTAPLLVVSRAAWAWLIVGALTHILLDTANITGVPLFWPARLEVVLVYNRGMRVPYGSPREFGWLGLFAVGALALLPLSSTGFAPWFHRLLGTTYGAVEDYLSWRDAYEVWADVHGHNLVTGEEVDARYRIVDALHTEELVVEDDAGRAYRVGLGQDADITVTRVTAWRGNPVTVRSEQVQVVGRIVVQEGDEVVAGQPVARDIDEAALARAEAGVEDAERVLEAAEAGMADADRAGALEARTALRRSDAGAARDGASARARRGGGGAAGVARRSRVSLPGRACREDRGAHEGYA